MPFVESAICGICGIHGVPDSQGDGSFDGSKASKNMKLQKHEIANCCCHLVNTKEDQFRFLPD